jgi:hypothetical protein
MWEFDFRQRLKDLATTELQTAKSPQGYGAALLEGNRNQEILQNSVIQDSRGLKQRIQSDLDNNKITDRDLKALYSTSDLFSATENDLLNKIIQFRKDTDGSVKDLPLGKTDDEILGKVYKSAEDHFGPIPEILQKTKTGDIPLHELMQNMETKTKQAEVNAASRMYSVGGAPMANEGIIEGTKSGSRIIAGENHTSEAVVSTKPNTVTESIGNNLYNALKNNANNDISSTQRSSLMIQDGLSNSKNEHFDMTTADPLASSGSGGSNTINNIMGGFGGSNDPNSQFNPQMLSMTTPDNFAQHVLMDIKKAELI